MTGRHERRGRHEICGAPLGPVSWGYTCDRIAGHTGGHWAESLKVDAPRGPITYPDLTFNINPIGIEFETDA